jgi:hypothetical protein
MSGWRIDVAGVQGVLTRVGVAAQSLTGAVDGLGAHAEGAVAGTASCPIIADALSGFFEFEKPTLTGIGTRISASVGGAAAATMSYVQGDQTMAAEQQAAAATAATGAVAGKMAAR